jgi:hypothetical protein
MSPRSACLAGLEPAGDNASHKAQDPQVALHLTGSPLRVTHPQAHEEALPGTGRHPADRRTDGDHETLRKARSRAEHVD